MIMFYKLSKWLYSKLAPKFSPEIPSDLALIFFGYDLERMRFAGKKLTVAEVDDVLNWEAEHNRVWAEMGCQTRMYIKNRLIQLHLMEDGVVPAELREEDKIWRKNVEQSQVQRRLTEDMLQASFKPCSLGAQIEKEIAETPDPDSPHHYVDDGDGHMDRVDD